MTADEKQRRVEIARARAKAYYYANYEKVRKLNAAYQHAHPEVKRRYYLSHKEQVSKRCHSYYEKNCEAIKAATASWRKSNPELRAIYSSIHSAKRRSAAGKCTPSQWRQRLEFYGHLCAYCGTPVSKGFHRDHVIPIVAGGANWPANLVPACRKCNFKKSTKRWLPRQPRPHVPLPL